MFIFLKLLKDFVFVMCDNGCLRYLPTGSINCILYKLGNVILPEIETQIIINDKKKNYFTLKYVRGSGKFGIKGLTFIKI